MKTIQNKFQALLWLPYYPEGTDTLRKKHIGRVNAFISRNTLSRKLNNEID